MDIIETFADGGSRVRFKTVSPKETQKALVEMIELWQRGIREKWVHPFVLAAALNLAFLCEGKHDSWPTINFLLYTLTQACKEFEQRVGQLKSPRGEKTAMVLAAIDRQVSSFRVADLQVECPGVGLDWIRQLLDRLRKEEKVECLGTCRGARWQRTGN